LEDFKKAAQKGRGLFGDDTLLQEAVEQEFFKANSLQVRVKKFRSNIGSASFIDFSSLPALTPFYQKGEGYSEGYKK